MIGSFIGDIAGSYREFSKNKFAEDGLLPSSDIVQNRSMYYDVTDDSIMTLATMHALNVIKQNKIDYCDSQYVFRDAYKEYGYRFSDYKYGYGSGFRAWLNGDTNYLPYNSCGNGSAMRVSPIGHIATSEDEVLQLAFASAACTHNHPEGIKGAQATALMIFLAKHNPGLIFKDIWKYLKTQFLGYTPIMAYAHFDKVCPETMSLATNILLTTKNFHDAVFSAVTTPNADSDTLGAIVGSIAEALYGIPDDIKASVKPFLTKFDSELNEFNTVWGLSNG